MYNRVLELGATLFEEPEKVGGNYDCNSKSPLGQGIRLYL